MNYLSISFRDFIKNNLIEETKKEPASIQQSETKSNKPSNSWITNFKEEFEKITGEYYDNLHKH